MYKGFVVDGTLIETDPHFAEGCVFCHRGDENTNDREDAHRELVKRPSDNLEICGECHKEIAENYITSLHYTAAGLRNGVIGRFSDEETKKFDEKIFEQSCRSCHASCGDCHVKGPMIQGISIGLIKGHAFVKRDEKNTCAFCHGGRVYPEFTGQYGVVKDVHQTRGMMCVDCHKKEEMHGDGTSYRSRKEVAAKPACSTCHPEGSEKSEKAREAHAKHKGRLSCTACHALSTYKHCYNCHLGKGAESKAGFILGLSPRDHKTITTLRAVPTVRDTFNTAGIKMEKYDALPNYWDTVPHVIRKTTERTANCQMCHLVKMGFLTRAKLIENGSKANEQLLYTPRPISR